MEFKFLHCGDLHLGCMPNHLEERYEDFFKSFKDLIDNAYKNGCKYILISGDVFHVKSINSKTLLSVTDCFSYANNLGLKIIAIEGNHDKAFYVDEYSWLEYLNKRNYITLLKHKIVDNNLILDDDSIYEDDNIRIIGIGYLGVMTSEYLKDLNKKISKSDKFTVLMLHAAINRLCGQDMGDVSMEELQPLKECVDYIALGHIHYRYEEDDFCYNPGAIEDIRITDAIKNDQKGYYIVTVYGKEKEIEYFKSIKRPTKFITVELNNDMNIDEAYDYLLNYDYKIDKDDMVNLNIKGNVKFNPYLIKYDELNQKLKEKYNFLYMEINNLINITSEFNSINNVTDLKDIEKEAIMHLIDVNYSELDDKENYAYKIQDLKDKINDNTDPLIIINNMFKEEN